ncbi:SNF2 family N-terminal domain-containing protein [Phyllosticta citribraziliensis]|uniref:SNF2 family N-terminal domain-containing protein n=1 Tax=Phyllosticta citribraziliensis TaxID=989973 RepID=A0ABR1LMT5_9PEZI
MSKSRKDTRRGPFRPSNTLSSKPASSLSSQGSDNTSKNLEDLLEYAPIDYSRLLGHEAIVVLDASSQSLSAQRLGRSPQQSPASSLRLGDSSSLFEESEYNPRLSPATPPSQRQARLCEASKRPKTSIDVDNLYWGGEISKDFKYRSDKGKTQELIMVNEREPPRPMDHHQRPPPPRPVHDLTSTPSAPKFGEASPLRNPLMRDQQSNVFINRKPGHRPEFHKTNSQGFQRGAAQPVGIPKPAGPKLHTIPPTPRQVFSSAARPMQGFVPINNYDKPKPLDFSGGKKPIDLTGSDDEFDADAAIRKDQGFGAVDPFAYVESNQANDNIKALLEGAFEEDDDDKPKTRLRRRKKKEQSQKEESKVMNLADRLKALDMKLEAKKAPEPEPEEEEEEEDDGTVDGLDVRLLPHQVDGVSWMTDKESGPRKKNGVLPKGGILADDMGLGKTIQSIALILSNPRPDPDEVAADPKAKKDPNKIPSSVGKSTLVVAPLALIKQWEAEIKTKVLSSHGLRVKVHHGQSRTKSADELKKYDVVITTYHVIASEHSASSDADGPRVGCFGVHWYRVMLDEAHTIKNRNAKMTKAAYALRSHYRWCLTGTPMQNNLDELQSLIKFLRIKPYDELSRWKNDIAGPMKNGRGNLAMRRLQVFLKAFMKRRTKDVLKKDGALNPGGKASKDGKGTEGFKIVGRKIETIVADFSPEERRFYDRLADRAQNRLKELMGGAKNDYIGALVLLLRLRQACNHPELVGGQVGQDKDAIAGAGSGGAPAGSQTPRKSKSEESKELDDVADLFGSLTVATKLCDVCQIEISKDEASAGAVRCADCEADLAAQKQKHKKKRKSKGKEKKPKTVELDQDEGDESPRKPARMMRKKPVIVDSDDEEEGDWVIPEKERSSTDLGKAGGTDDENADGPGEWLESEESDSGDEPGTPTPKKVINLVSSEGEQDSESESEDEEEEDSEYDSDSPEDFRMVPSTKITRLLDILDKETPNHKVIVFSQFTSMLDLLEPFLRNSGFDFTRYDGSMRNDHREASLEKLRNDPSCRILLCSLKCGSLGLNLTAASRVVILEPFWNPFVEEQAIDRVHRINQTVDVVVYKLTISRSVEERILDLQEAKRKLANAAIEGGKAINKLSMKDIMNLFRRDAEHEHPVDVDHDNFASGFKGMLGHAVGDFEDQSGMRDLLKKGRGKKERTEVSRHEHAVYGRR